MINILAYLPTTLQFKNKPTMQILTFQMQKSLCRKQYFFTVLMFRGIIILVLLTKLTGGFSYPSRDFTQARTCPHPQSSEQGCSSVYIQHNKKLLNKKLLKIRSVRIITKGSKEIEKKNDPFPSHLTCDYYFDFLFPSSISPNLQIPFIQC